MPVYAITVGFSITTFVLWILITGYSFKNKEIFWWLPINIFALLLMQPWPMRLSRVLWLRMFFMATIILTINNIQNTTLWT